MLLAFEDIKQKERTNGLCPNKHPRFCGHKAIWSRSRFVYTYNSVPGEIKRRGVELDPHPRRDHEQGGGTGLRKLDFFRFGLFLNSNATDIVFVTLSSPLISILASVDVKQYGQGL